MSLEFNTEEYYTAPGKEVFDDIKHNAQIIWKTYQSPDYVADKLQRIDIENISDNAWYIVAMFDTPNQNKLLSMVQPETAELIRRARGY